MANYNDDEVTKGEEMRQKEMFVINYYTGVKFYLTGEPGKEKFVAESVYKGAKKCDTGKE